MGVRIETAIDFIGAGMEDVTPCVGVRIETAIDFIGAGMEDVTPCVGVRIETSQFGASSTVSMSHPAWVCGLKPQPKRLKIKELNGHTLRGCAD